MSNSVRVEPQQERATRRLANFLDVAAVLFAEIGYEATTMTAIAERSGSGIGTLYHYFPDQQSMAFALLNQYAQKVEAYWKPLIEQAETLSHAAFAETFPERVIEFLRERPAYLQLHAARSSFPVIRLRAGLCALLSRTPLERRTHRSPAKRLC
ncbi:TetR/AcrR family transcriptional regulator [Edaphobacter modestus]|uniref:TetR/AcrR family transcriptional regulator n=1 Tax=Edaphobacter modestus TaxID=388466 RepID=UPI001F5FA713|nr:TetR/AcrR family transcriptional regulator [Edaphobacter modestus]